jgi:hypothetical protein
MSAPHFVIPNLSFNFYAFFLCLAVVLGEIYLFRKLKSVPQPGRILFVLLSILFTMTAVNFTVLFLPENVFSASLCGGAAFLLCSLLFDKFYNNPKIYKFLDIKQPKKIPSYYFSRASLVVAPLIYAVAKLGCAYAGCCHGFDYTGPFSLSYNNTRVIGEFFPVQPIGTIVFLAIFIYAHKSRKPFRIIILCALAKFFLDFLRFGHNQALISFNQIACLVIVIIAIFYKLLRKKNILFHK